MARKWIVEKRFRYCNNYKCGSYAGENGGKRCKVTLNPETGVVTSHCSDCKHTETYRARSWKEPRACKGCGHVRNVTVTLTSGLGEHARNYCDACELMASAGNHRETAARLQAKARSIYESRGQKSI